MGDKKPDDDLEYDPDAEPEWTDESYAQSLIDVERQRIERARGGDTDTGRRLLDEITTSLERGQLLTQQQGAYLIEILRAALDAPADGVSAAMHINRPRNRPAISTRCTRFAETYISDANGEPIWKSDKKRHAELLADIAGLENVGLRVVQAWWKEWQPLIEAFGLPDPPPDEDDDEE